MTAHLLQPAPDETFDERRTAWLAARKLHLTGTDAGKILTGRGLEVWLEKRNMSLSDGPTPGYMRRGSYFERSVLQWYADVHGVPIEFAPPFTLIAVPGRELFAATLDSRRGDDGRPVDAKTIMVRDQFDPAKGTGWGEDDSDQFPLAYAAQLYIQMAATQTARADLAVVFGFSGLVTFHLGHDETTEADLFDHLSRWWQRHIVEGVLPDADGSETFSDYLRKFVQHESDIIRDATPDEEETALRYKALKAEEKRIAEQLQMDGNVLRAAIGVNSGLRSPLVKVTWHASKGTEKTDWEAVARDVAVLGNVPVADFLSATQGHTVTTPGSRRLLVTPTKEKAR